MAAGLGFKDFVTGEVLTAADVDGYLMQGVWVFASAAARDAAVTSPQEGNFAYLKDTNVTTYYTGSAWANLDTTGMTNPMTTTGDTIYSSSGSTPARLGIGSTGNVLTVSGGLPAWAAPVTGGMTLLSTTSLSGSSTAITGISGSYVNLLVFVSGITGSTSGAIQLNGNSTGLYAVKTFSENATPVTQAINNGMTRWNEGGTVSGNQAVALLINDYASSTSVKPIMNTGGFVNAGSSLFYGFNQYGMYNSTSAITSLTITSETGGSFTAGSVRIYGVK